MVIFICPTVYASGGPEAIHQLAGKLLKMGIDTGVYYFNPNNIELDARLKAYNIPCLDKVVDSEENIIIFPEGIIDHMVNVKKAVKVLWWLSVDNASLDEKCCNYLIDDKSVIHFSQSYYSTKFITEKLMIDPNRVFYVSDYLNPVYLNVPDDWAFSEIEDYSQINRDRVVLFNPKKGFGNTANLIMHSTGDIKWQALNGMTPKQMRSAMQNAMIYVDFGNHPGMDRIPREAAVSGCCVFTNRNGSAGNDVDVPLDDKYKRDLDKEAAQDILKDIYAVMDRYAEVYRKDFGRYTDIIREQYKLFEISIYNAFSKINLNCTTQFRPSENLSDEILINNMQQAYENGNLQDAFRFIVQYRYEGRRECEKFSILEISVRNAIGELDEAKYCGLKAIKKYPESYELYLLLAQTISMIAERDGEVSEQNKIYYEMCRSLALENSVGTEDEDVVRELLG